MQNYKNKNHFHFTPEHSHLVHKQFEQKRINLKYHYNFAHSTGKKNTKYETNINKYDAVKEVCKIYLLWLEVYWTGLDYYLQYCCCYFQICLS